MNYQKHIHTHIEESILVKQLVLKHCATAIEQAVKIISHCFEQKGKLLLCGNGGSAADAQHIAAEFVIRLSPQLNRPALPAIALTTDTSVLTAGGNDFGFEQIFARQVEALGQKGDVLIGISTSGNSPNVVQAFKQAKAQGLTTIGLLGNTGGKCKSLSDVALIVPSVNVQHIQEAHITIGHILVELVEKTLFGQQS